MAGPNESELKQWNADLEVELSELDAEIVPLLERREQVKRQIEAVRLALPKNGTPGTGTPPPAQAMVESYDTRPRGPRPQFTPVYAYWRPTLESLVELGGSAESDLVIRRVGDKMKSILTDADKDMLPSGGQIRWKNRVAFQRENMKRQGLIRDDSPRGIWEITEAGREWLAN